MKNTKSKMIQVMPTTDEKARIGLYIRVSTDKQREENYSLEIQEERLIAYVKSIYGDADMVDEIESGKHIKERISIVSE